MKRAFDLEKPEFDYDSDDEIKMPYQELIRLYNKEYSLLLSETKQFYRGVTISLFSARKLLQKSSPWTVWEQVSIYHAFSIASSQSRMHPWPHLPPIGHNKNHNTNKICIGWYRKWDKLWRICSSCKSILKWLS